MQKTPSVATRAPDPERQAELWALVKTQPSGDAVESIRRLLALGADPSWVDGQEGSTPMHQAARSDLDGWVIAWKVHGMDLHTPSNSGWTQAMDAVGTASGRYLRRLLEVGLDPNDRRERTPSDKAGLLSQAAYAKNAAMVSMLLEYKAEVGYCGSDKRQAVHDAADSVECLSLLLAAGADVNAPEKYCDRLVHRVIEERIKDTFVFLLRRPEVNWLSGNDLGMVPLDMALKCDVLGDLMRTHMSAVAAHEAIHDMVHLASPSSALRGCP